MYTTGPRYRIQAVSELTGVSTATLRAWERRYGFPSPQRSDASYRLYSDGDVALVKRMQAMVETGVAPNEAARQLLAQAAEVAPPRAEEDPFRLVVERVVQAAETLDVEALQHELRRALLLDSGLVAFERILEPALIEIGDRWHKGSVSVAAEHLASQLIATAAIDLLRMSTPAQGKTALLACFAEEQHTLPLFGVGLKLAALGFRPVVLGARTPPSAVARAVEALSPAVVGLSCTVTPEPASVARELVDGYADACGRTPWLVGGGGVAAMKAWIEARGGVPLESAGRDAIKAALERLGSGERRPGPSSARGRTPRR